MFEIVVVVLVAALWCAIAWCAVRALGRIKAAERRDRRSVREPVQHSGRTTVSVTER